MTGRIALFVTAIFVKVLATAAFAQSPQLPPMFTEKACDPVVEKLLPRKEVEKIFGRSLAPFAFRKPMSQKHKSIGCNDEPPSISGLKRCQYFLGCLDCWNEIECKHDKVELTVIPRENMTLAPIPMLGIENDVQEMKFYCNEQKETCRWLEGIGDAGRTNPERETVTVLCGKHHVTVNVPNEAFGKTGDGPEGSRAGVFKTPSDAAVKIISLVNRICAPKAQAAQSDPKPVGVPVANKALTLTGAKFFDMTGKELPDGKIPASLERAICSPRPTDKDAKKCEGKALEEMRVKFKITGGGLAHATVSSSPENFRFSKLDNLSQTELSGEFTIDLQSKQGPYEIKISAAGESIVVPLQLEVSGTQYLRYHVQPASLLPIEFVGNWPERPYGEKTLKLEAAIREAFQKIDLPAYRKLKLKYRFHSADCWLCEITQRGLALAAATPPPSVCEAPPQAADLVPGFASMRDETVHIWADPTGTAEEVETRLAAVKTAIVHESAHKLHYSLLGIIKKELPGPLRERLQDLHRYKTHEAAPTALADLGVKKVPAFHARWENAIVKESDCAEFLPPADLFSWKKSGTCGQPACGFATPQAAFPNLFHTEDVATFATRMIYDSAAMTAAERKSPKQFREKARLLRDFGFVK
ncbi:MAG: hypothetical protein ABL958_12170 [Bdellovibrionia bacterium]